MKSNSLDSPYAKHCQRVVVPQATKLPLDRRTAAVEDAPLVAPARDARLAATTVLPERDDRHHVGLGALGVDAARAALSG
jgi:hypothetical protein